MKIFIQKLRYRCMRYFTFLYILNYVFICHYSIMYLAYVDVGCGPWNRAEGKCYLFGNGQGYTWNDARQKCLKAGSDLVKVDDRNENVRVEILIFHCTY